MTTVKGSKPRAAPARGRTDNNPEKLPTVQKTEELQNIQSQINRKTDESLESTRRMVNYCQESKDLGIRTLVMLDEQGEQLDRIKEGMDQINEDMRHAEKNLEGMEKCCGLCVLPWKRAKNFGKSKGYEKAWNKKSVEKVNGTAPRAIASDAVLVQNTPYITRVTNDACEDEMEQNLRDIGNFVSNMLAIANDIGNEVDTQNKQIDETARKAELTNGRIHDANKQAEKIERKI